MRPLLLTVLILTPLAAAAQNQGLVVRDGSLGNDPAGIVAAGIDDLGQSADYLIRGDLGRQVGRNLFHSFETFSIGAGETATFSGQGAPDPGGIRHVISRVTGGAVSSIDGTLRSTIPEADVWLLNPAGMVFGGDAQLDLDGSFHASTAEALLFDTGEDFETSAAGAVPVLEIASPIDFGFLGAGSITIDAAEIGVDPSEAIELVAGGSVRLMGGGGIGGSGTARLIGDHLEVDRGAFLELSGPDVFVELRGGDVFIAGTVAARGGIGGVSRIEIDASDSVVIARDAEVKAEREAMRPDGAPAIDGGDITIRAGRDIEIAGTLSTASIEGTAGRAELSAGSQISISGSLSADAIDDDFRNRFKPGFGEEDGIDPIAAGSVTLRAAHLEITGTLSAEADGGDRGGNLTVLADRIEAHPQSVVTIQSPTGGSRKLGEAGRIELRGAEIAIAGSVLARGDNGGDIIFVAESITMDGEIFTGVGAHGGDLSILTSPSGSVEIGEHATVWTSATQESGTVRLTSGSVEIHGHILVGEARLEVEARTVRIAAGARLGGLGEDDALGGDILVAASEHIVIDGRISVGELREGSITLVAPQVRVSGEIEALGSQTQLLIRATDLVLVGARLSAESRSRDGGTIRLEVSRGASVQGSELSASTSGEGGSITIAGPIVVIDRSRVAVASESAEGGEVRILSDELRLDDAIISAESGGDGGNIALHASGAATIRDSLVSANSSANGGNVTIEGRTLVLASSEVTATSEGARGGEIRIAADALVANPESELDASAGNPELSGTVEVDSPEVDLAGALAALSDSALDASDAVAPPCSTRRHGETPGTFVFTGRQGVPPGPDGMLAAWPGDVPSSSADASGRTMMVASSCR